MAPHAPGDAARNLPVLVFGPMPEDATPHTHWPAGPWCFAGREDLFPDWERRFSFPGEALSHPAVSARAAEEALSLTADTIPVLARRICPHADDLPEAYWETLLAPWAVVVASQIVERQRRVHALCRSLCTTPLRVPILPAECSFGFADEQDFVLRGALGADFNFWLFSRLLEAQMPSRWKREILPARSFVPAGRDGDGLKGRLRSLLLHLPFPRLKGMRLRDALRLSAALRGECAGEDRGRSLRESFGSAATHVDAPLPYLLDTLSVFLAALPESLRGLRHPRRIAPRSGGPRLRVASVAAYEDAAYRRNLAVWRARGHRIAYVQHGGNYGQIAAVCATAAVEYVQHAFVTWGWNAYEPRGMGCGGRPHFLPLPHPQLAGIRNAWRPGGGSLILVGTEMPAYAWRLDARPSPLQTIGYRNDKARFLRALAPDIRASVLYRPYFDVPGSLNDAGWLLPRFPDVRRCEGPLEPQMLSCRLLVLDHNGTTLLQALAAGIPFVAFWNRAFWPLTPEADGLLDVLAAAGVWHATPESAAAKVREIWDDPLGWRNGPEVDAALRLFASRHALAAAGEDGYVGDWLAAIASLRS